MTIKFSKHFGITIMPLLFFIFSVAFVLSIPVHKKCLLARIPKLDMGLIACIPAIE